MLYSQTDPILESSKDVQYYCMNFTYVGLKEQFESAGLCVWNNRWSNLFDFTPEKMSNFEVVDSDGDHISQHFEQLHLHRNGNDPNNDIDVKDIILMESEGETNHLLLPVTTGEVLKNPSYQILILFNARDLKPILKIYVDLLEKYTHQREKYWVKDTCLLKLTQAQTNELSRSVKGISRKDMFSGDGIISLQVCASYDQEFCSKIIDYLKTTSNQVQHWTCTGSD